MLSLVKHTFELYCYHVELLRRIVPLFLLKVSRMCRMFIRKYMFYCIFSFACSAETSGASSFEVFAP